MQMARGFSRLELLIVVIVIGIVSAVFLERLAYYQGAVEKAEMEYTLQAVKSALRLRMSALLTQGRTPEIPLLVRANPMELLERKPVNYLGALARAEADRAAPANWYFDQDAGVLVYRVRDSRHFAGSGGAPASRLRFRLKLVSSGLGGLSGIAEEQTAYVQLVALDPQPEIH